MEMARNMQRENSRKSLPVCEQICQTYTSQSFKTESFYSFHVVAHEREKTLRLSPFSIFGLRLWGKTSLKYVTRISVELQRDTHPKPTATQ